MPPSAEKERMVPLKRLLAEHTAAGELCAALPERGVQCFACGHRCKIPEGRDGVCRVRFNRGGALMVPDGYAAGIAVDPIEKKPFFHAFPGAEALSFGMLGCDFHCGYCQNWVTSQALRDPEAASAPRFVDPETMVELAKRHGCPVITSTYNEPLITSEWAVKIFKLAKPAGLTCSYVSNGNGTPQVLDYIRPWIDLYKVDLKSFSDKAYRALGGVLENVLWTIPALIERGMWVEIVTLIVPGFNDSDAELTQIAEFLAAISPDIPWHCTSFHPDYKMSDPPRTAAATLLRAAEIGKKAGLRYVYPGNLPGKVGEGENTYCPKCRALLVERCGFQVQSMRLTKSGACPDCAEKIPGFWWGGESRHGVELVAERRPRIAPPFKAG
jgi:pyruvate formate lyase activating enzyme